MAVVVAAGEPERSQDRTMTTTGSGATGRLYTSPRQYILPVTFSPQPFAPGIKLGRVREREREDEAGLTATTGALILFLCCVFLSFFFFFFIFFPSLLFCIFYFFKDERYIPLSTTSLLLFHRPSSPECSPSKK